MAPQTRDRLLGPSRTSYDGHQDLHHAYQVDQIPEIDYHTVDGRKSFVQSFISSKGPPQIVALVILLALGFGSVIGVVPQIMADRYARLHHGYQGNKLCGDFPMQEKPQACLEGSADAQNAVAIEQLISNGLTFLTSSLVGSISDQYGRKYLLSVGIGLSILSPLFLLMIQMNPLMSPIWYYTVGAVQGIINWIALALSALSDVMKPEWRAPAFGLLLAGFSLGFALAPLLALSLGHFLVSILSLTTVVLGFVVTIFFLPETLSEASAARAKEEREQLQTSPDMGTMDTILTFLYRPIWELSILKRSRLFVLLSILAFFSGLVTSGDRTLLLYYVEARLGFTDRDVATMFILIGFLGIFVQGVLLKFVNDLLGERRLVSLCFLLGVAYNVLYGIAETKATIFFAVALSSVGGMAFPTISAIKANNVNDCEQGRIQGALYSLQALASASGPIVLTAVYNVTKDGSMFGPGTMFLVAALLYLVAVYCACVLPDEANSRTARSSGLPGNDSLSDSDINSGTSLLRTHV